MSETTCHVRPLACADRAAWGALWDLYLDFYGTTAPEGLPDLYFERLLGDDPRDYSCLVAETGGRLVGLTHFLFHRHGWKAEEVCYLQDLYTLPDVRGAGIGRALIEGVYGAADAAGAPGVYWLTQAGNAQARQLYDRVAGVTDFIKYQRVLPS
ncbi:GNAT family N-acetyltransferase [Pseudooceanicola algae]|nr:GNAT family N-acetyltransferase [Pseudooceanicola algae]